MRVSSSLVAGEGLAHHLLLSMLPLVCPTRPPLPPPTLQCLFANQAFRRAVYALRQPLADEPIVKELR